MPSHVCVLGGGGFLGSHLVEALLHRSDVVQVTVLDRSFGKLPAPTVNDPRLSRVEGSVSDPAILEQVLASHPRSGPVLSLTALCNPALYNTKPRQVIDASFTDLVPLIDRCTEEDRWLVHFSTCEVYGRPKTSESEGLDEQDSPLVLGPIQRERWSYACAKQLLERLIWAQHGHAGLRCTIIRPFNVIGPRMDHLQGVDGDGLPRVLACFMRALLLQQPLQLVDGGQQRRAFISVRDFTDAVLQVLESPGACVGEILNIGNPQNDVSIAELARLMVEIYAKRHGGDPDLERQTVSAEDLYGSGYDDVERRIPKIAAARELLRWEPVDSIEKMLPPIIDDYVKRYRHRL